MSFVPPAVSARIIVLVGPTASGKTELSFGLAERWNIEVVSADSMQVYRGLDIGTAKPSPEQRRRLPHHVIDLVNPDESYNAARYQRDADQAIADIVQRGKIPLVAGGTGLYVKALLHGIFPDSAAGQLTPVEKINARRSLGNNPHALLAAIDPEAAGRIHPHDDVRAQRALEVFLRTGKSIISFQSQHGFIENRYPALLLGLRPEREALNLRIDERVNWMVRAGLLEETRSLLSRNYTADLPAMMGLGYRHMVRVLRQEVTLEEACRLMKRDTRRYAKRQLTWFQNQERVEWIKPSFADEGIHDAIRRFLDES